MTSKPTSREIRAARHKADKRFIADIQRKLKEPASRASHLKREIDAALKAEGWTS